MAWRTTRILPAPPRFRHRAIVRRPRPRDERSYQQSYSSHPAVRDGLSQWLPPPIDQHQTPLGKQGGRRKHKIFVQFSSVPSSGRRRCVSLSQNPGNLRLMLHGILGHICAPPFLSQPRAGWLMLKHSPSIEHSRTASCWKAPLWSPQSNTYCTVSELLLVHNGIRVGDTTRYSVICPNSAVVRLRRMPRRTKYPRESGRSFCGVITTCEYVPLLYSRHRSRKHVKTGISLSLVLACQDYLPVYQNKKPREEGVEKKKAGELGDIEQVIRCDVHMSGSVDHYSLGKSQLGFHNPSPTRWRS
ncbi:hypothetical protein F5X98DRAFT_347511 [Xylaria grammica]|nr:hypothetical protein F5X98DRAFT_347511 [Xylaria grammica]